MIDNNPKTVCAIGMSNIVMIRFYGSFFFFFLSYKKKKKLIFDRSALILINLF